MSNNKHLGLGDFQKSDFIGNIYNPENVLRKAAEHTKHKYLRKEGSKYIYHESYQDGKGGKVFHSEMMKRHHESELGKKKNELSQAAQHHGRYSIDAKTFTQISR